MAFSIHELSIRIAEPGPDREACYAIRREVFVNEQKIPATTEYDAFDKVAMHLLARVGGRPAGCVRWTRVGETARIGRLAVLPEFRGHNVGSTLMHHAIDSAIAAGFRLAVLHAQVSAKPFYAALGFTTEGDEFLEAGIPHVVMHRDLL